MKKILLYSHQFQIALLHWKVLVLVVLDLLYVFGLSMWEHFSVIREQTKLNWTFLSVFIYVQDSTVQYSILCLLGYL